MHANDPGRGWRPWSLLIPLHCESTQSRAGKGLKSELTPIPEHGLATMKRVLTSMAREKCSQAFQRFDSVNKGLDERPKDSNSAESDPI
eukprot:6293268-Amphidinium_carterae.2